jgi:hypothetical protein
MGVPAAARCARTAFAWRASAWSNATTCEPQGIHARVIVRDALAAEGAVEQLVHDDRRDANIVRLMFVQVCQKALMPLE